MINETKKMTKKNNLPTLLVATHGEAIKTKEDLKKNNNNTGVIKLRCTKFTTGDKQENYCASFTVPC